VAATLSFSFFIDDSRFFSFFHFAGLGWGIDYAEFATSARAFAVLLINAQD